jgi:putative transposase
MGKHQRGGGVVVPEHLYFDHCAYFVTAATYKHRRWLNDEIKEQLRGLFHAVFAEYGWTLGDWVILDNHYHLLYNSHAGRDLPRIINKIHNQSAQAVHRMNPDKLPEPVWYNYWDYCPRAQQDYDIRLCYLLNNPVKHGYVKNLHDWPWSSFAETCRRRGEDKLRDLFRRHREYKELVLPEDQFV